MIGAKLLLLAFLVFTADAHFRGPPLQPFPRSLPKVTSVGNVREDDSDLFIAPTEPIIPALEPPSIEEEYGQTYPVTTPQIRPQVPTRWPLNFRPRWPRPITLSPPSSEENIEVTSEGTPEPEIFIVYPENTIPPTRIPMPGIKSVLQEVNPKRDPLLDSQPEEESEADPGLPYNIDTDLISTQEEIVNTEPEQDPIPEPITTFVIPGEINISGKELDTANNKSANYLRNLLKEEKYLTHIAELTEPLTSPDTSSLLPQSSDLTTLYPTPPATEEYDPFEPDLPSSTVPSIPPPLETTQNSPATTPSPNYYPIESTPILDYKCQEGNNYYTISKECDTYFECKQFVARKHFCPDGLVFNPEVNWPNYPCAYPTQGSCYNNTIILKPTPNNCPHRYGTFPDGNGDCSKYFICQDGRADSMICPKGLAFNPKINGCDWPENVPSCKPNVFQSFTCPAPPMDMYGRKSELIMKYRYKNSCKYFIACLNGEPRLLQCDAGLSFDETAGFCVESASVVNCKGL